MLIRRSKPDNVSTSEASSPFSLAQSVNALKKSPREKVDEQIMPSKQETVIAQEEVVEEQK